MPVKNFLASMAMVVSLLSVLGSGCASSPGPSASSPARSSSGIYVEQVPITGYMRSQEGTPNELSPLAPPQARNIRKVGNRWLCEMNGGSMVFNGANSCWEPQR
jgi:hypothetical protein